MRSVRALAVALLCALAAAPALARDDDTLKAIEVATAVRKAFEAADEAAVTAAAESKKPSPWLVADELEGAGALDVAIAFAARVPGDTARRLSSYLQSGPPRDRGERARAWLHRVAASGSADDPTSLDEKDVPPRSVLAARCAAARGQLLVGSKRDVEGGRCRCGARYGV